MDRATTLAEHRLLMPHYSSTTDNKAAHATPKMPPTQVYPVLWLQHPGGVATQNTNYSRPFTVFWFRHPGRNAARQHAASETGTLKFP